MDTLKQALITQAVEDLLAKAEEKKKQEEAVGSGSISFINTQFVINNLNEILTETTLAALKLSHISSMVTVPAEATKDGMLDLIKLDSQALLVLNKDEIQYWPKATDYYEDPSRPEYYSRILFGK